MKNALWFLLGLIGGFVAAHLVSKDPRGRELLADVDARISEFTDRMGDAYRAQEAKIESFVTDAKTATTQIAGDVADTAADAKDAAADAFEDVKDAAADAREHAADAASDAADAARTSAGADGAAGAKTTD